MSSIKIFDSEEFGKIHVVMIDDEPWFVAADVCRALEIWNPSQALTRLDDDEKNTLILNEGNRGNPNVTVVNEPGLYTLVLSSRKPEAKKFKRWVTHEVLPSIRKTGSYSLDGNILDKSEPPVPVKDQIEYLIQLASITTEKPLRSDIIRKAVRLILG